MLNETTHYNLCNYKQDTGVDKFNYTYMQLNKDTKTVQHTWHLKKSSYQLMQHICATRLVKLCNLKKMVCQFKMNMCADAKLKATSCATTCIVVPTDDSFLCNFQKSDQTSKEHKKKKLLEKNKENSLVICQTHQ